MCQRERRSPFNGSRDAVCVKFKLSYNTKSVFRINPCCGKQFSDAKDKHVITYVCFSVLYIKIIFDSNI